MSNRIFNQLGGIVQVRITGEQFERVMNRLTSRGVYIWDIRTDEGNMRLKVRATGLEALRQVVQENGGGVEVVKKSGAPFIRRVLSQRLGFAAGALLFVGLLWTASSFIWFIDIQGNQQVAEEEIMTVIGEQGLRPGRLKTGFDRVRTEREVLKQISQLSYVEINVRGVMVSVAVVEKIQPETVIGAADLVARREGVVEDVLLLAGTALVREGEAVLRGDVLIAGYKDVPVESAAESTLEPSVKTNRQLTERVPVRASGTIQARVWYEGYGESALRRPTLWLTGNRRQRFTVILLGREWTARGAKEPAYALGVTTARNARWETPLGTVGWSFTRQEEQSLEITELTARQALEEAKLSALEALLDQEDFPGVHADIVYQVLSRPSDSIVRVKATAELIEDITTPRFTTP